MRQELANQFEYAESLLQFWLEAPKDSWLKQCPLHESVIVISMALHTQGCRLFRAIIEDCSRCEAFAATFAARGLFETVLALEFVLRPKVHVARDPVLDKQGKTQKKTASGVLKYRAIPPKRRSKKNLLSQDFRAALYQSHMLFQIEKYVNKCLTTNRAKRVGRGLKSHVNKPGIAHMTKLIGEEWAYTIRDAGSYSGLNIETLAKVLSPDLHLWYVKLYGPQSWVVHGTQAASHVNANDDGTVGSAFLSSPAEVFESLLCGSLLYRMIVKSLNEHIDFGVETRRIVTSFDNALLPAFKTE